MALDSCSGYTPRLLRWMAWRRYLTSVRSAAPGTYEVVEAHAWERLVDDLARVGLDHPGARAAERAAPTAPRR